jgi:hypothetical protein
MAIQLSVAVRDARLNSIQTQIGASAILGIYTGSVPANCAASTTGTLLVQYNLASSWLAAASAGSVVLNSLPLTTTATGNGTAGYFRLFASDGVTCGMQGTVAESGGDLNLDNTAITSGQTVNITGFTLTDDNA